MRAAVRAPICPLFSAPAEGAERVDELLLGMEAEVTDVPCAGWVKVLTEYRYAGFARSGDLLRGEAAARWSRAPKAAVLWSFRDLLSAPDHRAPVGLTLPRGALVSPTEAPRGEWQAVRLPDGREGFLRSARLAPWPPASGRDEAALRESLSRAALGYLGTPYRWGGKTPLGIDCSGLAFMSYWLNGIAIFRDARLEPGFPVREIPAARLDKGDLIWFPGHVALYLGEGRYIHASAAAGGVVVNSLDPEAPGYRADLAGCITACGSAF